MIKAIIFDFDGLILDTETTEFRSWQEMYTSLGCELPLSLWHEAIGAVDQFDPYEYLESQLGQALDQPTLEAQRRRRDTELLAAQTVLPGVEAYLAAARQAGLQIGLASSSRREWVEGHLRRLGLLEWFDVIRCRDDVDERAKPDPAVYLATLAALGVEAHEALALEDSANGALAAKRAGIYCVVVPNEMTGGLNFERADRRLASLLDISLRQLIAEL
jgi:HAD superfamily hydrolase (TIGR01509 family)